MIDRMKVTTDIQFDIPRVFSAIGLHPPNGSQWSQSLSPREGVFDQSLIQISTDLQYQRMMDDTVCENRCVDDPTLRIVDHKLTRRLWTIAFIENLSTDPMNVLLKAMMEFQDLRPASPATSRKIRCLAQIRITSNAL